MGWLTVDGGFHLRGYPRQFFSTDVGHSIGVGPAMVAVAVKSSHVDPQSVGLNVIESGVEPIVASSLDTSHRYQKVARDDVRVHFEKEGPDMMFMRVQLGMRLCVKS